MRKAFQEATVFPRLGDGRRHVGFILPIVEFGGVEKVALQMARGLRSHGWVPHAFVLEASGAAITSEWQEVFESVSFLADKSFRAWGGGHSDYFGTNVPHWSQVGKHETVVGMLHWLDVVVNAHGGAAASVMGQLRRLDIVTVDSLHLNDLTAFGRPVGNTYLGLAYEHAFDLFAPCSLQLGAWLHGMGVPESKIVPVQNAPGFEVAPLTSAKGQADRRERNGPLRVLYLGRLDRQKGLDRLTRVFLNTAEKRLAVEWRIIGKTVLAEDAPVLAPEIEAVIESPLSDPEELAAAYTWADVVILMSRYEGLPLTILEAMRAGAVPIATDVGAVSEVIIDGKNGILLGTDAAVEEAVAALERLSVDRDLLLRISEAAFADRAGYDWEAATSELHIRMTELYDKATLSSG